MSSLYERKKKNEAKKLQFGSISDLVTHQMSKFKVYTFKHDCCYVNSSGSDLHMRKEKKIDSTCHSEVLERKIASNYL